MQHRSLPFWDCSRVGDGRLYWRAPSSATMTWSSSRTFKGGETDQWIKKEVKTQPPVVWKSFYLKNKEKVLQINQKGFRLLVHTQTHKSTFRTKTVVVKVAQQDNHELGSSFGTDVIFVGLYSHFLFFSSFVFTWIYLKIKWSEIKFHSTVITVAAAQTHTTWSLQRELRANHSKWNTVCFECKTLKLWC